MQRQLYRAMTKAKELEAEITKLHRMLAAAWALLPPEEGKRLGIEAEMVNCRRDACAIGPAAAKEE
jgi:hypothetical protein